VNQLIISISCFVFIGFFGLQRKERSVLTGASWASGGNIFFVPVLQPYQYTSKHWKWNSL